MLFDESKVSYSVRAVMDAQPVRGNAMASGDDAVDRRVENEILARLDAGDVWAWAAVTVTATYEGIPDVEGVDHLGGCSYAGESDFCQGGGYWDDMKQVSRDDLRSKLESIYEILEVSDA